MFSANDVDVVSVFDRSGTELMRWIEEEGKGKIRAMVCSI